MSIFSEDFAEILLAFFEYHAVRKSIHSVRSLDVCHLIAIDADAALFYCPAGFGAGGGQGGCYEEAQNVNRAVRWRK